MSASPTAAAADAARAARPVPRALLSLMRPHQWIKNGLLLAALVFSRRLFHPADAALASLGLLAFCALSSATYVLNDVVDRDADRQNPEKCGRPLACGEVSIKAAVVLAAA
ncbi:MAG: UbiA family prenyltransferase, partial [Candidatus Binataceae bacterium]